jgi:methylated-DNA-protein-cysteine methyltransferase related protein
MPEYWAPCPGNRKQVFTIGLLKRLVGKYNIYKKQDFVKVATWGYTPAMPSVETLRIMETLRRIPRGKVASYGAIGALAGLRNGARQVVRVLHASAEKEALPWFRVLRKDGSIALPPGEGFELQRALLDKEGVEVSPEGKVDLGRFGWSG